MAGRYRGYNPLTRHSSGMFTTDDLFPLVADPSSLLCFWDTADRLCHDGESEGIYDLSGNDIPFWGAQTYGISQRHDGFLDFSSATIMLQVAPLTTAITNTTIQMVTDIPTTSEAVYLGGHGSGANGYWLSIGNGNILTPGNNLLGLFGNVRWIDTNYALGTGKMLITMIMVESSVPSFYKNTTSISGSFGGAPPLTPDTISCLGYISPYNIPMGAGLFYSKQLSSAEISHNYDIFSSRW